MEAGTVPVGVPRGALRRASPALFRLASDNQLVRGVRAGRPAAFEVVYDRYHRPILSFCAQLLGDRHEAEDAVQHTFMAAYDSLLERDQPIQLKPWLFAIARNRCYTVLRARREIASAEMVEGEGENPANVVQRREDLRDLVCDVTRLPDDQRAALVMAELGALSHDEIALALEVPREKVKALVFQARESLLATRSARETDCAQIREELSAVRGAALRRSHLRRHLHACEGCREYRLQLRHQRAHLAALIPAVPTAALKETVLQATVGARTASAGAGGGTAAAAGSSALKLALVKPVAVAILSVAGAAAVVHTAIHHGNHPAPTAARTPVLIANSRHIAHAQLRPVQPRLSRSHPSYALVPHRPVHHDQRALLAARPTRVSRPAGSHQAQPPTGSLPVRSPASTPASAPTSEPIVAAPGQLPASHEAQDHPMVTPTETQTTDGGPSSTGSDDGTGSTVGTTPNPTCTDRSHRRHHRHHHAAPCSSAVPKPTAPTPTGTGTTAPHPSPTTPPTTTAPRTAVPGPTGDPNAPAPGTAVPAPTGDPSTPPPTTQPPPPHT